MIAERGGRLGRKDVDGGPLDTFFVGAYIRDYANNY
jgi:hypothetical protein